MGGYGRARDGRLCPGRVDDSETVEEHIQKDRPRIAEVRGRDKQLS